MSVAEDGRMTPSHHLHARLIGQPGSRDQLNTPALIVDRDALDANIAAMARWARDAGVALRPHAKTHKSAEIGKLQIAAGAVGLCCAKLGEAEALAAEGIESILLTSPVVTQPAIARLVALHERIPDLALVADHPDAVAALAVANSERPIRVLVDIDPGIHRTGVASPDQAAALARQIADAPGLEYGGVQFYCGSQQHIATYADRRAAIADRTDYLQNVMAALGDARLTPPVVTGGGTGTHRIDAELGVLTELQVGSYVFMDREYAECDLGAGFATALMVDTRVISSNTPGMATLDAGLKAFATEAGMPAILAGAPPGSRYRFMGDEQGAVLVSEGATAPLLGARVTAMTPHCDPTVNLYDAYHLVRGDTLVAIWPVTARGRSA
ncbi:DSD1 family PLP-dependent enzyme [Sphingomonas sp.]|jgi:D-serine deaminase-like pyridoxal phosphate-dependent protein|uniref:DSD1 family PLP-dependent enzyme n=1 Tax=Sphingomonas sp. TaxID=28214 RepID=UPI002E37E15F|nr:DSD1 family PLP-dependent enzyme [Sphingomonas sp.]HEX4695774.1 DSD1 family PLP-dependent enzyme [Sphingomonas sp.]